jgi:hypothetical protein
MGMGALGADTKGNKSIAIGTDALGSQNFTSSTDSNNIAIGFQSCVNLTTGQNNIAIGNVTLDANTTGANNTALGFASMTTNTTGANNVALGRSTLSTSTTGNYNTAVGYGALTASETASNNTGIGNNALGGVTTGASNTAVGSNSLVANTTAINNTAVGYRAGYSQTTGDGRNVFIGRDTGYTVTGNKNTIVGDFAGSVITSGSKNTIIGRYDGNSGGLDIRTSSNYIVLSDGDGNPRGIFDNQGNFGINTAHPDSKLDVTGGDITVNVSGTGLMNFKYNDSVVGSITTNGAATAYNTSSDYRLKENVDYTWDATTRLKQLKPARFNFIADETNTLVDGFIAHEVSSVVPEAITGEKDGDKMQGIDQSKLVPLLVKTIQELEARITALES